MRSASAWLTYRNRYHRCLVGFFTWTLLSLSILVSITFWFCNYIYNWWINWSEQSKCAAHHSTVILLYFKKPGYFPIVVERKAQIPCPWIFVLLKKYIMIGQFLEEEISKVKGSEMDVNLNKCPFQFLRHFAMVLQAKHSGHYLLRLFLFSPFYLLHLLFTRRSYPRQFVRFPCQCSDLCQLMWFFNFKKHCSIAFWILSCKPIF